MLRPQYSTGNNHTNWCELQHCCSILSSLTPLGIFSLLCILRNPVCTGDRTRHQLCPYLHESYPDCHSWSGRYDWEYLLAPLGLNYIPQGWQLCSRGYHSALWHILPLTLAWVTVWEKDKLGNYAGLLYQFKSILSFVGLRVISMWGVCFVLQS